MAALLAVAIGVERAVSPAAKKLVGGDFRAFAPLWSPTGTHIAFLIEDKVGAHLAVFDFAKGGHLVVGDVAMPDADAFSWSPDGKRLAYVGPGGESEFGGAIRIYDVASTRAEALAPGSAPRFRTDGTLVAVCGPEALASFDSDSEDGDSGAPVYDMASRFCRMDTDSGAVTRTALAAAEGMALSPLLDRVVFARETAGAVATAARDGRLPDVELFVADLDRGEPVRLSAAGEAAFPSWTPAGDRILHARNGAAGIEFWTMREDGGDRRPLLQGVKVADPMSVRLSPDGERVFFVGPVEGDPDAATPLTGGQPADLHIAPVGGGTVRRLPNEHSFKQRFAVSPDGERIAYEVPQDVKIPSGAAQTEIWLMSRAQ